MIDLNALKAANAKRWANAKLIRNFDGVARALVAAKSRYLTVQARTGVPWYFIAIVHEREASQSWAGSLAQGDPWNKVSVHVPAGRGPFASWEDAAVDALVRCSPFAAKNTDWSVGGLLTEAEKYNGLGYAAKGVPSPYVWAGTNQYSSGKYVRDGVYEPNAVDRQLGCAGLLLAMMAIDPTITFTGASARTPAALPVQPKPQKTAPAVTPAPPAARPSPTTPSITNPARGSIGAFIASVVAVIAAVFKPKG